MDRELHKIVNKHVSNTEEGQAALVAFVATIREIDKEGAYESLNEFLSNDNIEDLLKQAQSLGSLFKELKASLN